MKLDNRGDKTLRLFQGMERYDVIKTIGKGAGGKVLLATEKNSSRYSWVHLAEQTGTILFIKQTKRPVTCVSLCLDKLRLKPI